MTPCGCVHEDGLSNKPQAVGIPKLSHGSITLFSLPWTDNKSVKCVVCNSANCCVKFIHTHQQARVIRNSLNVLRELARGNCTKQSAFWNMTSKRSQSNYYHLLLSMVTEYESCGNREL